MLEENDNTDVFPPYGVPVAVSSREGDMAVTGRFFPADARPEDTGGSADYTWTGPQPPTPEQQAECQTQAAQLRDAQWQAQRGRPRYRHLLTASNSHILEVLCEDLPTWRWATGR